MNSKAQCQELRDGVTRAIARPATDEATAKSILELTEELESQKPATWSAASSHTHLVTDGREIGAARHVPSRVFRTKPRVSGLFCGNARIVVPWTEPLRVTALQSATRQIKVVGSSQPGSEHAYVLVVEDDAQIREIVKDELEDAGYTVAIASHADAAVAILEAGDDIHLVFTDIDMPGSMDLGSNSRPASGTGGCWLISSSRWRRLRPPSIPANALFIPKPYVGRNVVAAMRTFENM